MDGMAPARVPTLAGPRLVLRVIRPDDLQTFLGRVRDPEIVRMRGGTWHDFVVMGILESDPVSPESVTPSP